VTQCSIQNGDQPGRLDILLLNSNYKPVLIIENKISASAGNKQMALYRGWLQNQNPAGWPGAICLLTHITEAPEGFLEAHPYNTICRWSEVYKWLQRKVPCNGAGAVPPWMAFAGELAIYLKEEGMCSEYISECDIAACHMFIKSGAKFKNFFPAIYGDFISTIVPNHHRESIF
jgi:hypothetical protein